MATRTKKNKSASETPAVPAAPVVAGADLSFAVNAVKLNRAVAHVRASQPGLKGADFAAAVKERYVEIKGLLREDAQAIRAPKKGGRVENLADDDGSDDEDDE